jgi:hypothetical protein
MTSSHVSDVAGPGQRHLSKRDWTIIICGALVLVASFLPWEAASASGLGTGYSASDSAWNAGFAAWFGSLLCAAAAAAVAAKHLGYAVGIRGIGPNLAVCGLAAAGAALVVIRLLTLPRGSGYAVLGTTTGSYGPSFGAFAGVALAVVEVIVALLNVRAAGERLPSVAGAGRAGPNATAAPRAAAAAGWPAPPAEAAARPYRGDQVAGPYPGGQAARPYPGGQATGPNPADEAARPYPGDELAQRLSRLDSLRSGGMISDSEYAEQRRRIINQL